MQYLTIVLVLCLTYLVNATTKDYCTVAGCVKGTHVACGVSDSGTWASICSSPGIVDMTNARIAVILDTHNKLRSQVARGDLPGFASAVRMQTLQWDTELANLATINVKQCKMKHDKCRSTDAFPYAGQNLAYIGTTGTLDVDAAIPELIMNAWFSEYNNAVQNDLTNFGKTTPRGVIGHFTAVIHEKTGRVGCALSTYKSNGFKYVLFACNYSFANMIGIPIYTIGPKCSKCTTGCNSKYSGLCNTSEVVSPSY